MMMIMMMISIIIITLIARTLTKKIIMRAVVSPTPNPEAGGLPRVCSPRLLVQYIHSYPPYLEAISSTHNIRMSWVKVFFFFAHKRPISAVRVEFLSDRMSYIILRGHYVISF
jgi:hypothetical protein